MINKSWIAIALIALAIPALTLSVSAQAATPLINPNTATEADLSAALPQPVVQVILAKRPFAAPHDLDAALAGSLSEDQRRTVYMKVFVPLNLNTATDADIMLIPGMNRRMTGEFKEYRPYRVIGQFRHEIGKYVSKEEVARLETYVFVPGK